MESVFCDLLIFLFSFSTRSIKQLKKYHTRDENGFEYTNRVDNYIFSSVYISTFFSVIFTLETIFLVQ